MDLDLQTLVETVKWVRKLKGVSPLKDIIGESLIYLGLLTFLTIPKVSEANPGPNVHTDEQIGGRCT